MQQKIPSEKQQLNHLLDKIPPEALKQFVRERCCEDDTFSHLLMAHFMSLVENKTKADYQRQIRSTVASIADDDYGFIGWGEMRSLEQGIDPIMATAEKYLEQGDDKNAIELLIAIMEEMTEVLQYCDDSNGTVGGYIESSYEALVDISVKTLTEPVRQELFDYCLSAFDVGTYQDWDWHLGMLDLAVNLATDEKDIEIIIGFLQNVEGDYELERAQCLQLELLEKYKDAETVQQFINAHIANSSIRYDEIEKAVAKRNFERAIKLCHDGIQCDEKDKPGLVKRWYDWLLTIALQQDDKEKIIEYARFRLINNFSAQHDYYAILKQHIAANEWNDFLENIITEVTANGSRQHTALVRQIYINEKWSDRLLALLKQNASLEQIKYNEKYLAADYSPELIALYRKALIKYVDEFLGRTYYQTACAYLTRIKKLDGEKEAEQLIQYFKETYPRRRALIEELNNI